MTAELLDLIDRVNDILVDAYGLENTEFTASVLDTADRLDQLLTLRGF